MNLASTEEAINSLVKIAEYQNSKKNLPGLATVLDDYEIYSDYIRDIIVALMNSNTNAEARAKKDFEMELEEKSQLVTLLQKSISDLTQERDKLLSEEKKLTEQIKFQLQNLNSKNETILYQKKLIESQNQEITNLKEDIMKLKNK